MMKATQSEASSSFIIVLLCVVIFILLSLLYTVNSSSKSAHNNDLLQQQADLDSIFKSQQGALINPEPKIAYVFAGSARSFPCPKVHWSIRSHLIDSLGGEAYSFVRISTEDNLNTKTGLGTLRSVSYSSGGEIKETLKILNPKEVEYFKFSEQLSDMQQNYPSSMHAVFRENDQRRYSMFYHRCMAYKMVLRYEQKNNMKFDWVVLVRLDATWLEPVSVIDTYSRDRVWLTETGFDLFNDQFMLIPRQFSDYLYNFDTKVQKGVYCLGGPDVEKWKCDRNHLRTLNKTEAAIEEMLEYCCSDRNGLDEMGFSEQIHKRHLLAGKIPVAVTRFPQALTRVIAADGSCQIECERLQLHTKEQLASSISREYKYLTKRNSYDTRAMALSLTDHTKCALLRMESFPWRPVSATWLHLLLAGKGKKMPTKEATLSLHSHKGSKSGGKNGVSSSAAVHLLPMPDKLKIDYSRSLYKQRESLHPSLLMNQKDLEAWRIHPTWNVEGCLSYSFDNATLQWNPCVDHLKYFGGFRQHPEQAFFLQVIPHVERTSPKLPTALDAKLEEDRRLKTYPVVANSTRVVIPNREAKTWYAIKPLKCVTIVGKIQADAPITVTDCLADPQHPSQLFQTVHGLTRGTHHWTTVGRMHVAANPELCVSRSKDKEQGHTFFPVDNQFGLLPCWKEGAQQRIIFEFEFLG